MIGHLKDIERKKKVILEKKKKKIPSEKINSRCASVKKRGFFFFSFPLDFLLSPGALLCIKKKKKNLFIFARRKPGKGSTLPPNAMSMEQCVALCDYTAEADDEISFKKGDVITVVAKGSASGFWEGVLNAVNNNSSFSSSSLNGGGSGSLKSQAFASDIASQLIGKRGLFPNCFVTSNMRPHVAPTFCDRCIALYDYTGKDATEMSMKKGDCISVIRRSSWDEWWLGVNETMLKRMLGDATSSSSSTSKAQLLEKTCGSAQRPLLFPVNFMSAKIVMAAFGFTGRQAHELSFNAGNVILIYRKWNDGWWEGTLEGRRGIFPSNYSLPNISVMTPPLFCNRCRTLFPSATQQTCPECAKNEEITASMMRALDDIKRGVLKVTQRVSRKEGGTLHDDDDVPGATRDPLFAYVELDPAKGGRSALLSVQDTMDRSVRKEPRDAIPRE